MKILWQRIYPALVRGAAVDASCKRLLADKSILAWILKDCVEEYRNSNIQDIAEKYIESEPQIAEVAVNPDETNPSIRGLSNEDATLTEGTVTYDIRFMASAPVSGRVNSANNKCRGSK